MKYTHLFWDFDGTLYDTYPQILNAMLHALRDFGLSDVQPAQVMPWLKHSVYDAACHFAPLVGSDPKTIYNRHHQYHRQDDRFPPYEGLAKCLKALWNAGCSHYLYTHRDHLSIVQLERDGLWQYFSGGVTSEDGFPSKPAPDALLHLLEKHQLEPERCLMIGDRGIDIESALNAGIAGAIFDPDGYYFGPQVSIVARSMAELEKLLLKTE